MDNAQISCSYCDRKVANLKRCGRCLSIFYCSKVCQTMDWPSHKSTCAKQTEIRKKGQQKEMRSDHKKSFEKHKTAECGLKSQANASKQHNVDLETTHSHDVYRHGSDFDDNIEAKMKMEYSTSIAKGKTKADQRSNTEGSGATGEISSGISVANIDNIHDDFEFKDDQINTNLSNAKPNSRNENRSSVTNNDGQETSDLVTKAKVEEKGVSDKNTCEEKKSSAVENDFGKDTGDSVTSTCGEEKDDAGINASGEQEGGSDSNTCREEKAYEGSSACGKEKGDTGTSACREEKGDAGTNASGEEKGDAGTNACGEEKGDAGTNACGEEKGDTGTNACGEEKGDAGTDAYGEGNGGTGGNTRAEEKGGSVKDDSGEEKGGLGTGACGEENDGTNLCSSCGSQGCYQKCSRCKAAFYCSKKCQKKDWPTHKVSCIKELTEEEKIIAVHKKWKKEKERHQRFFDRAGDGRSVTYTTRNFEGPHDRFMQMLTLEQALYRATRHAGSLQRARRLARIFFPIHDIVTDFDDVPWEPVFPFFPFMFQPRRGYVLVAFMYRYHEHVMRHGVYLKDAEDKESKVEFYLDDFGDNPFPFFSYSQVKPGGYICLVDPVMHMFMDGTVGIRINNPSEVMVLNIEMVMK